MIRNDSFEADNGFLVVDGPFITGGPSSPVGSVSAIAGDLYIQNTGSKPIIWQCTGATVNDWKQLQANDLPANDQFGSPDGTIQDQLDNVAGGGGTGVAQTLIYGNGGNTAQNNYLQNNGVPSNVVGVPVGLSNATIRSVFLGNENIRTGNVLIQQRFPAGTGTWTTIHTFTLSNESYKNQTGLTVPVTQNAEIACFTEVSLKNVKVVVNVNGDSA